VVLTSVNLCLRRLISAVDFFVPKEYLFIENFERLLFYSAEPRFVIATEKKSKPILPGNACFDWLLFAIGKDRGELFS